MHESQVTSAIIDVDWEFLQGRFKNSEEMYVEVPVPDGFEGDYPGDIIIRINIPLYGAKQMAYCFFKTYTKHVKKMMSKQSKSDLCVYFVWVDTVLVY